MFNASQTTGRMVVAQVTDMLVSLRNAASAAEDTYKWMAGVSDAELTAAPPDGLGMTQADVDAMKSAIADARAIAALFNTGLPPAAYPQPPSAYVYGVSVRRVIGPRRS